MTTPLKFEFPSQGWRQVMTGRREILDAYDRAREQSRGHEVETFHGHVAEASMRKWLSDFLPTRYGVTSGYVVSPGLPSTARAPHYDVIVYDRLESPVLWVEDTPDASAAGRSLAIPVEFVCAVLEVKSQLTAETALKGIEHLADLGPLMQGVDDPAARYKLYLPPTFVCGMLFVELRPEVSENAKVLPEFIAGHSLRGFFGGVVLRGAGHTMPQTGRISLLQSEHALNDVPVGHAQLLEFGIAPSVRIADECHMSAMLKWSESGFAEFAFDLIAMMRGTYEPGRLSSFYGFGQSFAEIIAPLKPTREATT